MFRRPRSSMPSASVDGSRPSGVAPTHHQVPSEEQIARVFQNLSNQHSMDRARLTRENDWRRVRGKWHERLRRQPWILRVGWPGRVALAGAVCCVAVALVVVPNLIWRPPAPLTYELRGTEPVLGVEFDDGWVKTGEFGAALDFSDGSKVEIEAHSAVTVNVLGEHSAWTRINEGKLSAEVHHADSTKWSFFAGPYEVRVVGTAFDLSWSGAGLSLSMREGEVNVIGPEQKRWVLRKGENLTLPATAPATAPSWLPEPVAPAETEPSELAPTTNDIETRKRVANESLPPTGSKAPTAEPSHARPSQVWSQLLAKGKFSEVVQEAKARGLTRSLQSVAAGEVAALAQAATYTGDSRLAEQSWLKLRGRFPGSSHASRAAFFLARIKEQSGHSGDAIRWLDTYLSEAPRGAFVAEAFGRKLVVTRRLHGSTSGAARRLAREYIKRFPQGAYVETARATLAHR